MVSCSLVFGMTSFSRRFPKADTELIHNKRPVSSSLGCNQLAFRLRWKPSPEFLKARTLTSAIKTAVFPIKMIDLHKRKKAHRFLCRNQNQSRRIWIIPTNMLLGSRRTTRGQAEAGLAPRALAPFSEISGVRCPCAIWALPQLKYTKGYRKLWR